MLLIVTYPRILLIERCRDEYPFVENQKDEVAEDEAQEQHLEIWKPSESVRKINIGAKYKATLLAKISTVLPISERMWAHSIMTN